MTTALATPPHLVEAEVPTVRPPALQDVSVDELVELAAAGVSCEASVYGGRKYASPRSRTRRAVQELLTFLSGLDGAGWQDRWAVFEAMSQDLPKWYSLFTEPGRNDWTDFSYTALGQLVRLDVVRPSYLWLVGRRVNFWLDLCSARDADATAVFLAALQSRGVTPPVERSVIRILGWICGRKGKTPRQVTAADVNELHEVLKARYTDGRGGATLWSVLHGLGWLDDPAPIIPMRRRRLGQKTPAEMVDRYQIASPHREVLIEYLTHRSPSLDHGSLLNLSGTLAGQFWADIARHHPGLTDFRLSREVAAAWKARLATHPDGSPRLQVHGPLFTVRAFYLDIAEWAAADSYWAPWVAPSPVNRDEVNKVARIRKQATARTQQRTFERAPLLPALVAQAEKDKQQATAHLAAARAAGDGATIDVDGRPWQVVQREPWHRHRITDGSVVRILENEETVTFWTWAVVETLRHSGLRIEEMFELTHLAFQSYTVKATGEVVPLVHIPPSKTDEERMLVASPELVHVLSDVLKRIRVDGQAVPLTQRWDPHERVLSDPLPHLFVHPWNNGLHVLSQVTVHKYLNELAARANLQAGERLITFTPHDFRRIFATEALAMGLPPHIVQALLGHKSLATTMGYAAIYQQDVIRHHRTFIATRRQTRPSEEYREPTAEEWAEFEAHFVQRKISLGTCGRAYGTNCHHEHACIRCALLRPDPAQIDRLRGIITNLEDRIEEAEQANWLGEVEGLRVSHAAAQMKLKQMQRQSGTQHVDLGLPPLPSSQSKKRFNA